MIREIENEHIRLKTMDQGATILSLSVRDRDGQWQDVVLGYQNLEDYETYKCYLGALVGRTANRIRGGRCTLNGKEYQLPINNGPNCNHGGRKGLSFRTFESRQLEDRILFEITSPDGEEGYPGTLQLQAQYILQGDTLVLRYEAQSSEDTLLSLTNHSYFNLAGHPCFVGDHELTLAADAYGHVDENGLFTGELESVEGTPFDFRRPKAIKEALDFENGQIALGNGLDHPFAFSHDHNQVVLYCPETGIEMTVSTTMPAAQVYSANYLGGQPDKNGAPLDPRTGVCIETSCLPDDINLHPDTTPTILKKGETWTGETTFRFKTRV